MRGKINWLLNSNGATRELYFQLLTGRALNKAIYEIGLPTLSDGLRISHDKILTKLCHLFPSKSEVKF